MCGQGWLEQGSWGRIESEAGGGPKGWRGQMRPGSCGGGVWVCLCIGPEAPASKPDTLLFNYSPDAMELIDVAVPLRRNTAKSSVGKINTYEAVAELPKRVWDQRRRP